VSEARVAVPNFSQHFWHGDGALFKRAFGTLRHHRSCSFRPTRVRVAIVSKMTGQTWVDARPGPRGREGLYALWNKTVTHSMPHATANLQHAVCADPCMPDVAAKGYKHDAEQITLYLWRALLCVDWPCSKTCACCALSGRTMRSNSFGSWCMFGTRAHVYAYTDIWIYCSQRVANFQMHVYLCESVRAV
jgi:hypothetical protein